MPKERILIVDDEPKILFLISRFLKNLEYEIETAEGGEAALTCLRTNNYALVLSDLKMPAIDGWTILREVKERHPDTIFIMMTAFATISSAISALRQGVYDFLTKPLDPTELTLTVQRGLEHRALTQQNRLLIDSLQENNLQLEALHRAEQRKAQQLRQVNALSRQITAILDMDELADTVIQKACQAFRFCTLSFGIVEGEQLTFRGVPLEGHSERVQDSAFWKLTHSGQQPFVSSQASPDDVPTPFDLIFPLRVGNQVTGFWVANWSQDAISKEENLPYLESLAAQTAVVMENARLYALAKRADELAFLNHIGEASKQSLHLKDMVQSVLICIQSSGAWLVEICLFEEMLDTQQSNPSSPVQQVFRLVENQFEQGIDPILGRPFIARIKTIPLIIRNQAQISDLVGEHAELSPLRSLLGVPLYFGKQPIGVLTMGSTLQNAYSAEDGRLIQVAGRQVAMAIENARLFQKIESQQRAVLESRNTLLAVFDSILDGIYIINREKKILAINRTQADRTGRTYDQLVYQPAQLAFPQSQHTTDSINKTFETAKPLSITERIKTDDGTSTEWAIHTYPVPNPNGQIEDVVVVVRDITKQRQLELLLLQSEKMASVGQLAAGIAHEINNPMTVISANVQILREELDASHTHYQSIELIHRATERASKIVRNLLNFSRPEQFKLEPADLNLSLQEAISLIEPQIQRANIQITTDLDTDLPLGWISPDHLQIVWVNLILNARDAIQETGRAGEIKIKSYRNGEWIAVRISDNGIGMSPDEIKRVYDPFFTTKAPNKGTGLGLFNSYRTIRRHNGQIHVNSQQGQGTSFEVRLPIKAPLD